MNGLYKAELIRRRGAFANAAAVELATAAWVAWSNQSRIHSSIGNVSPAEFEAAHTGGPAAA